MKHKACDLPIETETTASKRLVLHPSLLRRLEKLHYFFTSLLSPHLPCSARDPFSYPVHLKYIHAGSPPASHDGKGGSFYSSSTGFLSPQSPPSEEKEEEALFFRPSLDSSVADRNSKEQKRGKKEAKVREQKRGVAPYYKVIIY